jgi:hypothetical protein
MVYAPRGWYKSTVMGKVCELVGDSPEAGKVARLGTISEAAFRGSPNDIGQFDPPKALTHDILFLDEFGTVAGDEELIQIMNQVLEGGKVSVDLKKISNMRAGGQISAENKHPTLKFIGGDLEEVRTADDDEEIDWDEIDPAGSFRYKSDCIMWACTYKPEHIQDAANASRWAPVFPEQKLTSELTRYVDANGVLRIKEETVRTFRRVIEDSGIPSDAEKENIRRALRGDITAVVLPERIYEEHTDLNGRMSKHLKQYLLGLWWWGKEPIDGDVDNLLGNIRRLGGMATEGQELTVKEEAEQLITDAPLKVNELADRVGCSDTSVYNALNELRDEIRDDPVDERIVDFDRADDTKAIWTSERQRQAHNAEWD